MTEISPASQPYFFGKDKFVPFYGQVENVNDPKRSGRVQVRCVGWHPKEKEGEDGLKTEDLPWAKVGMPTTHAQQSRIGGKHGLLPGTWVWGYFMDGEDAQDPFIVQTFNFTAKASDQDFRQDPQGKKGKLEQSDQAFDKFEVGGEQQPNIATRTPSEEGQKGYSNPEDPSGDVTADESIDECSGEASRKSVAAVRRMDLEMKKADQGNAEAQTYEIDIADGLCGTIAHARDDIQKKMKEQFPSEQSRFIYNDAVWNRYTGQFMNLNGIFAQLALEMSSVMKQPMQSMKAVTEEINRITKGTALLIPDRDGVITQASDLTTTTISDIMHGIFGSQTIDLLFETMMGMMKGMNNSGDSSDGGSGSGGDDQDSTSGYPGKINPTTQITNNEARCLTDTILSNIEVITEQALTDALTKAESDVESDPEGYESGGASEGAGAVNSVLSGLSSIMAFPLTQKYSVFTSIFNKAGPMSQDILTKDRGCANERQYKTSMGTMASSMGFGGGSGGGSGGGGGDSSSETGSSGGGSRPNETSPGNTDPTTIGFGGLPAADPATGVKYVPCEDATLTPTPDPGYGGGSTGGGSTGGGSTDSDDPFEGGNPDGPNYGGIPNGNVGITPIDPETGEEIEGPVTVPVNPNDPTVNKPGSETGLGTGTETVVHPSAVDENGQLITPTGQGATAIAVSLPASTIVAADNFNKGIPNNVVILAPGVRYFYNNQLTPDRAFPSIYIPGYNGVPTPVVDRVTGELVAIVTEAGAWAANKPNPKITLIPDDSPSGIVSDDLEYDIRLSGFFIENTGFNYTNPKIEIVDRDNKENVATAAVVTSDQRIVEVTITKSGSRFLRLPEVIVTDPTGFGAVLRPIMTVTAKAPDIHGAIETATEVIYCPSKNQANLTS
ncbi:putative baseplate hub subunit and tail lysozyme [Synechococcus phage S-N03]|uniref:Putative baseplate hub subunit and tail lysozyme n=1 Tax=Synechococcus phage S-N03 TaxID=2718943 RepID=A0A6G8R5V9_9CAUD|nr:baseplate hub subunit and tail lysozyme [Synechococcus phage S-N03]QIN96785.1 putative baseplate hub subunit and tail lysozyme [Synechococcus phage S-N03]